MRFAKQQLDYDYVYQKYAGNPTQQLGDIIEIEGDYYVVFDGRQNRGQQHYEDVWFAKDFSGVCDNWIPIFGRDEDGIFFWELCNKQWKKYYGHPKEHLIDGYSVRDAIMNVMGY
jgi:hypothetical protein